MNCHTARAALDWLSRPGEVPPEFDAGSVSEHFETCTECMELARQRQKFDSAVSQIMQDVAVPSGLRVRLSLNLASRVETAEGATQEGAVPVNEGDNHVTLPKSVAPLVQRPLTSATSLRVTRRAALIACSLLVPVAIYFLFFAALLPKMSLESLHGQLVPLIGTSADHGVLFVNFETGQSAPLPQNNLRAKGLRGPYLATLQSRGQRRRAAAYFLEITGKSRPIPGALVVVPLDALELSSVPSETSFLQSTAIPLTTGVFVSVWREGDLVYLCYVRGTEGDLRLLWQRSGSA